MPNHMPRPLRFVLFVAVIFSVSYAQNATEETAPVKEDQPVVVYKKASTWVETVRTMRQALFEYKTSFIFSADPVTSETGAIPIDVDLSHQEHLWLVSNRRGLSAWCTPQLVKADGTNPAHCLDARFSESRKGRTQD
ncbi:MAG: hypothetical protein GY809_27330 [Planctomycetes bacterium]|nr:hypothetical protein [Planctomycetota bacterium]